MAGNSNWRVVGREPTAENRKFGHWDIEGDYLIAGDITYDDAAFIVRAVNSHQGLVEAVKLLLKRCGPNASDRKAAEAALALASRNPEIGEG